MSNHGFLLTHPAALTIDTMNKILSLLTIGCLLFAIAPSVSGQDAPPSTVHRPPSTDFFQPGSFYVAPFALAVSTDLDRRNFKYGAGIKAGYDITRTFAVEGYAAGFGENSDDLIDRGRVIDVFGGDAKFRQPFLNRFAVTESLGVDYDTNERNLYGHARAGLEAKFTRNIGAFADAGLHTDTRVMFYSTRAGFTFTF